MNAQEASDEFKAKMVNLKNGCTLFSEWNLKDESITSIGSGWRCDCVNAQEETQGVLLLLPGHGCYEVHGAISCEYFDSNGGPSGWLGFPVSDEEAQGNSGDRTQKFEHGEIVWHKDGDYCESLPSLTKAQQDIVDGMSKDWANWQNNRTGPVDVGHQECRDLLKRIDDEIKRNIREFDAKRFLLVVFGSLKAGKSTLVNAFAGKKISSMGAATETTLRANLVMAADHGHPEGVYIYDPVCASPDLSGLSDDNKKKVIDQWHRDNAKHFLDYLRGIISDADFKNYFAGARVGGIGEIEKYVTNLPIPAHPNMMPPVVRIDLSGGNKIHCSNIVKDHVILVDTPGLNGTLANYDNDPFAKILSEKGDCFLFVQSSMSALTKEAYEYIQKVYECAKNASVIAVFNRMEARYWLEETAQKAQLATEGQAAFEDLKKKLQKITAKIPPLVSVNTGEAWDSFAEAQTGKLRIDSKKAREESGIDDLKRKICGSLQGNGARIKVANAKSRMEKNIKDFKNEIAVLTEVLEAEKTNLETECKNAKTGVGSQENNIKNDLRNGNFGVNIENSIKNSIGGAFGNWPNVVNGISQKNKYSFAPRQRYSPNGYGKIFQDFVDECNDQASNNLMNHTGVNVDSLPVDENSAVWKDVINAIDVNNPASNTYALAEKIKEFAENYGNGRKISLEEKLRYAITFGDLKKAVCFGFQAQNFNVTHKARVHIPGIFPNNVPIGSECTVVFGNLITDVKKHPLGKGLCGLDVKTPVDGAINGLSGELGKIANAFNRAKVDELERALAPINAWIKTLDNTSRQLDDLLPSLQNMP